MMCNWENLLGLIPGWMRQEVDDRGRFSLQELRLRLGEEPELVLPGKSVWLRRQVRQEDLLYCVNTASRFSPWAAKTMSSGYLTSEGGHRIGVCGSAAGNGNLRSITSLCIRVARDIPGIARDLPEEGSVLILGAPGWGKTTLLRDLIRRRGEHMPVSVTDERGELFPPGFSRGRRTDVITGIGKAEGITRLLRTMGPGCIAVDEITEEGDCRAMQQAAGCGATVLASAHATCREDFLSRPLYRQLAENGLFDHCVVLDREKHPRLERMRL